MAGVIDAYLAAYDRDAGRDPTLARLREEVEDHLRCAAEADPAWPGELAERRAVARFGPPRALLAPLARDALDRQAIRTWRVLAAALAASFVAMRLRTLWLAPISASGPDLAHLADRFGFIAALVLGLAAWVLFHRRAVRSAARLLGLSLAALAVSILAGLLRGPTLAEAVPPAAVLGGLGAELALGCLLLAEAWRFARRGQTAARLSGP